MRLSVCPLPVSPYLHEFIWCQKRLNHFQVKNWVNKRSHLDLKARIARTEKPVNNDFFSRPGFNEHAAAEAAVLFAQGRAPANLSPAELQHYQAEQAVLAAQQNLLVQSG